jgi:hypothetical protein
MEHGLSFRQAFEYQIPSLNRPTSVIAEQSLNRTITGVLMITVMQLEIGAEGQNARADLTEGHRHRQFVASRGRHLPLL